MLIPISSPDFLPYGRQTISEEDIEAVTAVLRSDFLTTGPEVEAFEADFRELTGAPHAVAFSNATAALHAGMVAGGIGPGDRVITSPNSFLSSANCAAFTGAIPDFADIDPVSHNLDPEALLAAWKDDVRAVVPVAYGGQPADMPRIAEIARSKRAFILEDASHATGGAFQHEGETWKTGAHPWADMTVFSFHPVKTMTTGEGGMLVTGNAEFARKARAFRAHGIDRDPGRFEGFGVDSGPLAERGPWVYEMQELGQNHRITDIQCALGRAQLRKLPGWLERRREIVATYNREFADLDWLETPGLRNPANRDLISWHLYTVGIDFQKIGLDRTAAMAALKAEGVGSQVLYIPIYLQPYYRRTYGYAPGKCPVAERFYSRCLSLPLHPSLSAGDVGRVVSAVRNLGR